MQITICVGSLVNKIDAALPFKTALEANPKIEQFLVALMHCQS